jgi:orotidine-5'-phosphate decarboxylase
MKAPREESARSEEISMDEAKRGADRIIVALDLDRADAERLVERLGDRCRFYKVGLSLFVQAGPGFVRTLVDAGKRVFLDLKLHDIPFQVQRAVEAAAGLGAELLTVHALGGRRMIEAAVDAASGTNLKIIAVTVLTSMGTEDMEEVGIGEGGVARLARLAREACAHGIVLSGQELSELRGLFPDFIMIVPGIRPSGAPHVPASNKGSAIPDDQRRTITTAPMSFPTAFPATPDDQRRTITAAEARARGADYLVVGRPITRADNPLEAFEALCLEVEDQIR